ncbi:VOC family protein [Streptomyces sp. NPDC048106]|uniref:VOC family protein n=1 Tax=Streptomyces sp. NPDC048106 TaxID=3155750 RepID=UPI0034515FF8
MNATVRSLGYAVLGADDLEKWRSFATEVLGLQVVEAGQDTLRLRMDGYLYRLQIEKSDTRGVTTLGWEVAGPRELAELARRVEQAGYTVERPGPDAARARDVTELVRFQDPDGLTLELFYGLTSSLTNFVSPTGNRFVAGRLLGLGHAFQLVKDPDAHLALYRDVLGFRLSDHIEVGPAAVATFLHCNPRHHSFAFVPTAKDDRNRGQGVGHLMLESESIDGVGRALDALSAHGGKMTATLGKHTNDKMISFYCESPSGTGIEYGTGGIEIDDETWTPTRYPSAHYWGHER